MAGSRFVGDFPDVFSDTSEEVTGAHGLGMSGSAGLVDKSASDRRRNIGRRSTLARAIEMEIIPRLMLAHRAALRPRGRSRNKNREISPDEIHEFARIITQHDASVAEAYAEAMIDQGASVEKVFTKLFAPAARLMGEWWESDLSNFSEVTIGLTRIHQLVHALSPQFASEAEPRTVSGSTLLVPMPGEQHSLGILLLEQYFRRAGWNVWTPSSATEQQLVNIVRQEHYDMVGISVTCDPELDRISELILRLRKASINKEIVVMVGGRVVNARADFVKRVGADATDIDGSQAVQRFESIASHMHG